MQSFIKKLVVLALPAAMLGPVALKAQEGQDKKKEKKQSDQIIITRTGDDDKKVVIEIDGDKVLVNGKPADESKDVSVHRNKIRDVWAFSGEPFDSFNSLSGLADINRPMLGVTTEKNEDGKGVKILSITKESGAAKAGLKEGDIITKIDDKEIVTPDDLSEVVRKHKSGDKVSVTYQRDKKENKATAELTKWKGVVYGTGNNNNYSFSMPNFQAEVLPRIEQFRATTPRVRGQVLLNNWNGSSPRLGLSIQDTEDANGVKVLEADEDGNGAKAGIKEGDIITEVDGKAIKSTDEIAKIMKENKEKISVIMKLLRNGKAETVDVKIPRRLKTTDL